MTLIAVDTYPACNPAVRAAATKGKVAPAAMLAMAAQARAAGLLSVTAGPATPPIDSPAALDRAFTDFKAHHNNELGRVAGQVDKLQEAVEAMNLKAAVGGDDAPSTPVDREYTAAFRAHLQRGGDAGDAVRRLQEANGTGERHAIQASMSSGDASSGGYLAPTEWDRTIGKAQRARSPMRRLAQVVTTTVGAYTTLWSNDAWGSGWTGETAARPQTTTPTLANILFGHGEIYAAPAVTQRLLDDAELDLEGWLGGELADAFDKQEGVAFLSGDGVNKPFGFLQYVTGGAAAAQHPGGVLDVIPSGAAAAVTADGLIDFKYGLLAPYRQNASWLMNSQTAAAISKLKSGDGAYIWSESLAADQPATLLGRPVEIDEGMPNVEAGNLAIAFGDFRAGYVINDRVGVRILRDPYTNKPFVTFYATKRVGGGIKDPRAIRLLKVAAA